MVQHGRDASGQYYRRNRFYDAATGRFTQEDPIRLAGGLNLYGFANGDPVSYSDPYGLCPWWMQASALICEAYDAYEDGGVRGVLDLGIGLSPVLGDFHDGATALTGRNAVTRERVGTGGRVASGLAAAIPFVSSRALRNLVGDLYKGAGARTPIGTGSTADAIRHETATGQPVGGRWHLMKGQQYIVALQRWLTNNPNSSARDAMVARSILEDLRDAVNEALRAGRTR